ncbi:MAG: TonB-dependent receptor [Opitutae bacterium]
MPAQLLQLDPLVVSIARAPQASAQAPFSLTVLSGADLRAAPTATLDGALRTVPGFSLFRRSDSLTANPTAQGVSLRGLGPSGASRSLVLLDGVPLNDPFGGWVAWSKVPRESLTGAEVVRGGGATAWGNAALGGIMQLLTNPAPSNQYGYSGPESSGRVNVTAGDFSTRSAELALRQALGSGRLQVSGRDFATAGFPLVAPERRGTIDEPAASRHQWLNAGWSQPVGTGTELALTARSFSEHRDNGTPYQRNSSRENFGSVALRHQATSAFGWTALVYGQAQTFASTFSAVNADRTAETPASNQYAVPASAFGAAWTGSVEHPGDARTSFGADLRHVRGETREYFSYVSGDYTRERRAGGGQDVAGLFVWQEQPLTANLRASFGGRLDFWRERDGHRRETTRATGAELRDEFYGGQEAAEFSPGAGLVWQAAPAWRVRAVAQQAFRRPTLNELYRPFRVGNVITEANPSLRTEHVTSAELRTEYATPGLTLSAAVFWNELRDAVANVTIARGPGTFPVVGFVPAGGLGRQRLNLASIRVQGVELTARWRARPSLTLDANFLYDDATVREAGVAPALVGRRLAQVPLQAAALSAAWQATRQFTLTPRLRALGRQFEDDENLLILGAVVIVDLSLSYQLTPQTSLYLTAENLGNARIETGRSPDGVVNTGTPRYLFGGLRAAW